MNAFDEIEEILLKDLEMQSPKLKSPVIFNSHFEGNVENEINAIDEIEEILLKDLEMQNQNLVIL